MSVSRKPRITWSWSREHLPWYMTNNWCPVCGGSRYVTGVCGEHERCRTCEHGVAYYNGQYMPDSAEAYIARSKPDPFTHVPPGRNWFLTLVVYGALLGASLMLLFALPRGVLRGFVVGGILLFVFLIECFLIDKYRTEKFMHE